MIKLRSGLDADAAVGGAETKCFGKGRAGRKCILSGFSFVVSIFCPNLRKINSNLCTFRVSSALLWECRRAGGSPSRGADGVPHAARGAGGVPGAPRVGEQEGSRAPRRAATSALPGRARRCLSHRVLVVWF